MNVQRFRGGLVFNHVCCTGRSLLQVTWLDLTFSTDPKTHPAAAMRRALFLPLDDRDPLVQVAILQGLFLLNLDSIFVY